MRALVVLVASFRGIERLGRRRRRDKERVHRRDLLAVEFGVVVLIEQEQLHDAGGEAGDATQLSGIDRIDDVHDLGGRHPHDVARKPGIGHVAGMPAQEVVGHAPSDRIELDALADYVAAGHDLVAIERQHLRGEHLQLQRHREPVLRAAWAEAKEHLARDEHLAGGAALQAIKVRETFSVGFVGPVEPELLDLRLERRILDQGRRLDAGAHHIARPALDRVGGIAVVAYEPAGAGRDVRAGRCDQRVEMRAARLETLEPAVCKPRLEAADKRPDPASEPLQRNQHRFKVPSKRMSGFADGDRRHWLRPFGVQDP